MRGAPESIRRSHRGSLPRPRRSHTTIYLVGLALRIGPPLLARRLDYLCRSGVRSLIGPSPSFASRWCGKGREHGPVALSTRCTRSHARLVGKTPAISRHRMGGYRGMVEAKSSAGDGVVRPRTAMYACLHSRSTVTLRTRLCLLAQPAPTHTRGLHAASHAPLRARLTFAGRLARSIAAPRRPSQPLARPALLALNLRSACATGAC